MGKKERQDVVTWAAPVGIVITARTETGMTLSFDSGKIKSPTDKYHTNYFEIHPRFNLVIVRFARIFEYSERRYLESAIDIEVSLGGFKSFAKSTGGQFIESLRKFGEAFLPSAQAEEPKPVLEAPFFKGSLLFEASVCFATQVGPDSAVEFHRFPTKEMCLYMRHAGPIPNLEPVVQVTLNSILMRAFCEQCIKISERIPDPLAKFC